MSWAYLVVVALGTFVLGILVGLAMFVDSIPTESQYKGQHSYHLAIPISRTEHVEVRRVLSPCAVDDEIVETIIDGVLVSRSKAGNK